MNEQDLWAVITADKAWNRRQGQLISDRITKLFKNIPRTAYWVSINYFAPDNAYNIFFNIKRNGTFQRSIPIAQYSHIKFETLIEILKEVRKTYQFTFNYTNFTKEQLKQLYREVD